MEKLRILVGRSSQCDYIIENNQKHGTVSGKHATISETEIVNTFLFEDHSTNGSYINGQLLHNDCRKIKVTDHITLGKTYTLPLSDIVNRFFVSRPTTEKRPQDAPQKQPNGVVASPLSSSDETTRLLQQGEPSVITVEKVVEKEVEKVIEKVPRWYWVLYVVSILIAFVIGYIINYAVS